MNDEMKRDDTGILSDPKIYETTISPLMSVSPSMTLSSLLPPDTQWAEVTTWVLDTKLPPHSVLSAS